MREKHCYFFVFKADSLKLVLQRSYHYEEKKLYNCLVKKVDNKVISRDTISTVKADSILLKWQELILQGSGRAK